MPFVHNQDAVEQFPAKRSDQSFANCVRPGRSGWTGKDPYALRGEDLVERAGEPGVTVSEEKDDGGDTVIEVHHEVPSGLGGPRPRWMRRHPGQMCPARAMLDGDQRVDSPEQHGVHMQVMRSCA